MTECRRPANAQGGSSADVFTIPRRPGVCHPVGPRLACSVGYNVTAAPALARGRRIF